jgi:isoleucyl-tRNA synthetase
LPAIHRKTAACICGSSRSCRRSGTIRSSAAGGSASAASGALEVERQEKRIGSSLEAAPELYVGSRSLARLLNEVNLAELAITSGIEVIESPPPPAAFTLDDVPDVGVLTKPAPGRKCARCWQVLPEVGVDPAAPDLCRRCADAVAALAAA